MISRFVVRRLIIAFFQLVGISLVVFFLIRLLPADPVARLVGLNASKEAYAQAQAVLGLDRSLFQQLANYVGVFSDVKGGGILQGNLGDSWVTGSPIIEEIGRFLPITLELITYSLLIAFLIAVPMAMASATRPGGISDKITFVWGLFAGSQPEFWWGLMFVFLFFFIFQDQGWPAAPAPRGRHKPLMDEPQIKTR